MDQNNMIAHCEWKRKIIVALWYLRRKRKRRISQVKRFWIREIFKNRKGQGDFHNLVAEMRFNDSEKFSNYFRMDKDDFDSLAAKVGPIISKQTHSREPISAQERLALTLRYLASGDSMVSLSYAYRIGKTTVSTIISETCKAIWDVLKNDTLLNPTKENWLTIADKYASKWNMPHCIGAVDGKHVVIQAPPNTGSDFYNYKGAFSIVLMGLCDAEYLFTLIDVGGKGRQSDGGIFRQREVGRRLFNNTLNIPLPTPMDDRLEEFPYFIVGDEAFPLSKNIMRPYPGRFLSLEKRIFNYRQMVARIVQDLFRTVPAEILVEDLSDIMKILTRIGDESMLRADLLEQIPHIAAQAVECSTGAGALKNIVSEYLIPLVVRNLGSTDTAVDKAAHATLIQLIEQGFITKQQAEIQVCPSILALSKVESIADINTGAVTLMSKLAPLLGRDVTERVFLKRFSELCASHMFYVRKVCAAHFGEFCAVVGKEAFEKILLPCYITLCGDDIWGVRKACAEVIMFVSCACPPIARKLMLAPVFAKLLQDDCRWVKMSAFQTLGPFISTFADPMVTNIKYNKGGDLVLVNGDGNEFFMNCSQSLPENRPPLIHKFVLPLANEREDVDVEPRGLDLLGLNPSLFTPSEAIELDLKNEEVTETVDNEIIELKENLIVEETTPPVNDEKEIDEFLKEVVETVKNAVLNCRTVEVEQGIIGEKKCKGRIMDTTSDVNVITDRSIHCDNLADTINNELKDDMMNLSLTSKTVVENISNETSSVSEPIAKNTEDSATTESINKEFSDNSKKVNFINIESGTREDDDLHLFNSYNYWYISPDLPLDPSIIASEHSLKEKDGSGDSASHLEDLYSTINLSDSLNDTTTNYDSTVSIEEESNLNSSTKLESKVTNAKPEQNVVPQLLIDHFISMTDPNLALNIDNEMTYHCAYSLPAVALTLGSNNWHLLKNTVDCLASDMQYKVRRTVASGLHELALILGPEIATNNLTPLFDGFIKDLDEVRIGVLKHLAHFLKLIHPYKRSTYLPRLGEFLQTDNEWNWRFRQELAKQLLAAVTLFKAADTAKHIGVIARDLLCDKVAAVRQVALSLVTEIVRYTSTEPGLTASLLIKLAECFAHSKKWKRRQTFALLCSELLREYALPPEQFASEILPHLLDLSWDPVANVRLVVARCLARNIIPNEYFANPTNEHYDVLEKVLRRLQADKDKDVRQYAELEQISFSKY